MLKKIVSSLLAILSLPVAFVIVNCFLLLFPLGAIVVAGILVEGIGYLFGSPIDVAGWWEGTKVLLMFQFVLNIIGLVGWSLWHIGKAILRLDTFIGEWKKEK
ncbi:MAG: hypothetical protein OSA24_09135 [Longimicrobiales bacterium]|nr:hypothetical protein [Longimicrobiales bacterium]